MTILKDLCTLIVDCEHKTAPTQDTGYPSIRTPNIGRGRLLLDGVNRVSEETYRLWTQREVPQGGDLVLAREAPIGNVAIIPPGLKVCLGQRTVLIRPNGQKINAQYLTYLLLGDEIQGRIQSMSNGATVHHLNMSDIRNLEIPPLPSPKVQDQIASILSAYDDLIENNARRIKILDEMASMIYREWFVNFRLPSYGKVRIVQSDVGRIPDGWTTESLENICQRITDGSHWSPTTIESTYRMASSKDMRRWGLDFSECRTISKEDYDSLVRNDCRPLAGDVLITKDGANYLKYCFAVEKDLDVVLLSSVAMLRPREQALSTYLSFYLRDPAVKSRLSGRVSGAAIPRIVLTDFRRFQIMLPDLAIVRMFHDVVCPIVKLCCRLTECNQNLRRTRDFLLPKLISGEVNVEQIEADAVAQGV